MRRTIFAIAALFLAGPAVGQTPIDKGVDFAIAPGAALQAAPAIAYNPNQDQFFAVWTDFRNQRQSDLDVYGQLLGPRGRPIGPAIPISIAKQGQGFGAVAFDPKSGRYLVVWTDWRNSTDIDSDIYGRMFNADGTPFADEFPVSAHRGASQKFPAVALDPGRGRFLVVWSDDRREHVEKVHGRVVDVLGKMVGEEFRITGQGGGQDRTSLVFDSKRKRFLVIWREAQEIGKAIFGALVDPDQGPVKERFLVALEPEGCLPPSLYAAGYSPKDDLYFVAWTSGRDYDKQGLDVYGAFLRPQDGQLAREVFPIAAETEYQEAAAVAFDPSHNRFLVVWYDLRRDATAKNMDIYGRFVMPVGSMSDEFVISDAGANGMRRYPAASYSQTSNAFMILWEDGRERGMTGRQIYGNIY